MLKPDVLADGIPARVWEGETESGIKVHCFITRIATIANCPRIDEFEKDLIPQKEPSPEVEAYSNRLVL